MESDPEFLYLNDWNEWTAGKYTLPPSDGSEVPAPVPFLGRENSFYFVDQYNAEFNRTIQPMKGGYTDNYYMQMAQNIRRYKGVRPIPINKGIKRIKIDGNFSDWLPVPVEYRDTKGDVTHRDYDGYGGTHYVNTSGRNDILSSKVGVDHKNIYFYVETAEKLSPYTDTNWMLLLIDSDKDPSTGWYGYDFLINKQITGQHSTNLMQYDQTTKRWVTIDNSNYCADGNKLELAIPRKILGLQGASFIFDFKWSDNPVDLNDPLSLCIKGDTAPNRRFNYRCIWTQL